MKTLDPHEPMDAYVLGVSTINDSQSLSDDDFVCALVADRLSSTGSIQEALRGLRASSEPLLSELSDESARYAARGIVDALGRVSWDARGEPLVAFPLLDDAQLRILHSGAGSAPAAREGTHRYVGVAALDAVGRLFEGNHSPASPGLRSMFEAWCSKGVYFGSHQSSGSELRIQRVRPEAVIPAKERVSDSGYDLTLLYVKKTTGPTTLFGTGIIAEPPHGWYLDVVPRSSIIKRGYTLANNVGIIDRSYRGEIFVPLLKVDPEAPDLELPARVAQLIPRPIVHFPVRECEELTETQRGAGGFGSTGK